MKLLIVLFAICMSIALVSGQYFAGPLVRVRRQFGYNSLDFGGVRDPRQNRGPVVFPPSPPDAINESSGVIVGASGYGFVPPSQRQHYYEGTLPSFNFFNSEYLHRFRFY